MNTNEVFEQLALSTKPLKPKGLFNQTDVLAFKGEPSVSYNVVLQDSSERLYKLPKNPFALKLLLHKFGYNSRQITFPASAATVSIAGNISSALLRLETTSDLQFSAPYFIQNEDSAYSVYTSGLPYGNVVYLQDFPESGVANHFVLGLNPNGVNLTHLHYGKVFGIETYDYYWGNLNTLEQAPTSFLQSLSDDLRSVKFAKNISPVSILD